MKLLITTLLMPPGFALVLLAVGMYFLYRRKVRRAWVTLALALVLGWVGATQVFGRFVSMFLVAQIHGSMVGSPEEMDLIVVLTAGSMYTGETGWLPKPETYRRVSVAYELQSRIGSRIPVLISGGHLDGLKYPSEAYVAREYFDRRNAQLVPTIIEESGLNTYESALQVAAIAQKRSADQMFLVTSEVHMPRALATYRARGIDAVPFPVVTLPRGSLGIKGFLPTYEGAELTTSALYELYGLTLYLATGKISWSDLTYGG
ncbi:MAG: YdcF family protein [Alphaproteobacteria bacterium]